MEAETKIEPGVHFRHEVMPYQPLARVCCAWLQEDGAIYACALGYGVMDLERLGEAECLALVEGAAREHLEKGDPRFRIADAFQSIDVVIPNREKDGSLTWPS